MPDRHVLHIGDALALYGLGHGHEGFAAGPRTNCRFNGIGVMAVDLDPFPAERLELLQKRMKRRMALAHAFQTGKVVQVDKGDQVFQLQVRRHHGTFPGRTFLTFAIAQHKVDQTVARLGPLRVGHAGGNAHAVAERPGRCRNSGHTEVGMGAKLSARLAIVVEIRALQHAQFLENDILDHAAVPLGHQEHVRRLSGLRPAHQLVVDDIDDLGARKGRCHMQRADLLRNVENAAPVAHAPRPRGSRVESISARLMRIAWR